MGWLTKLNKFTDKIDPAARWTENQIHGKNNPTFGDHRDRGGNTPYVYNGPALPQYVNPMSGIPSQYTRQQGGQQMGGMQPMQMYQNRNQYQGGMAPMQMLNEYRQTGAVSEPSNTAQMGQLGTALNRLGGVNTSMGGSTPSIGGK